MISPQERRLRLGWRLAAQLLLLVIFTFALALPASILVFFLASGLDGLPLDLEIGIGLGVQVLATILSIYVARRFLDRRSFRSLGLSWDRHALPDLLAGVALAGGMIGLIFLIEWRAGWLELNTFAWETDDLLWMLGRTAVMLGVFVVVGWYEELMFRGYWLQNLNEGLNAGWGVAISSLVFALEHAANPNASLSAMAGITLAGIFFAYCYLRTGSLWLPVGLHIGWNFFEGTVFGFPVSGLEEQLYRLLRPTVQGPEIWTGGGFGPEAGLVLLPALLVGTAAVNLYTRARPRRLPPVEGDQPGRQL